MANRYNSMPALAAAQAETANEITTEITAEIVAMTAYEEGGENSACERADISLQEQRDTPKDIQNQPASAAREIPTEIPSETEIECALKCAKAVCVNEEIQAEPRVKEERGLMFFKKWWFRREVDFCVNGEKITGTPIVLNDDTLRVVDEQYSYFIPVKNVDYIRTRDGYGEF